MPLQVGSRIRQLILQIPHTRQWVSTKRPLPLPWKRSRAPAGPPRLTKFTRPPKEKTPPPPLSPDPLRVKLRSLIYSPKNADTEQQLVQLKDTPPSTPTLVCLLAEALAHHRYTSDALEVLSRARKEGMSIPLRYYEPVAFRLVERHRWEDVLALLEPLQSLSVSRQGPPETKLTTRLCEWRVRACGELGDLAGMERALGMFPHAIPGRTWEIAEQAFLRGSDLKTASKVRQVIKIDGMRNGGEGEGKEKTKERVKEEPEVVEILVSKTDGEDTLGDSPGSSHTVRITRKNDSSNGSRPTYLIISHPSPSSSHAPPVTHSFTPTARLAQRCVQALVQSSRVKEAAMFVASMSKNIPVSRVSSPTITTSAISDDSLKFDTGTIPLAEIFASVRPDVFVFNALLRGILDTRGLDGMLSLLKIMRDQDVMPNAETGTLLLKYLHRQRAWRPGRIIGTLVDLISPILQTPGGDPSMPPKTRPIPVSIQHTNVLLTSILHAERDSILGGGWKASAAFLKYRAHPLDRYPPSDARLSSSPGKTDPPTAGLHIPARAADLKPVIEALRARGVRNDSVAYTLRAQRDGVIRLDPETAQNVLQQADVPLGAYHYAALMAGLVECGYMDAAAVVMQAAHDAGIGKESPVMYTILVSGYARMGLAREAQRAFDGMREQGVVPDAIAVDALAGAWFISREYKRAREVVVKHWPGKGEPPFGQDASLRDMVIELRKLRPPSKVRKKRDGGISREEEESVQRILEVIKAPDKVLPSTPATEEKKGAAKPSSRKFSSVAGAGANLGRHGRLPVTGSTNGVDQMTDRLDREREQRVRTFSAS